ncbi:MAG TPA: hypothetical protein PLK12_06035 [Prolixibacteraceae bacterium]|nr:hypothetical protein [Prolixibacteraceae bacterium]
MAKISINMNVKVYIDEMVDFYKDDPSFGSPEKPYPADPFCELIAPYAKFSGPLKNILVFEKNSVYNWMLESPSGVPLSYVPNGDDSLLEMEMITAGPSDEKWKKMFVNVPSMDSSGKIRIKSKEKTENAYVLETTTTLPENMKVKYSIRFTFTGKDGKNKFGFLDPLGDTGTKPPPPPE